MAKYYELVIKGDDRDLIPYLAGFLASAGIEGVFFAEEAGLHLQALRERIRHHGQVQHVVCSEKTRPPVRDALARAAPRYRFELKDERAIARATFSFEVETPSRKVAQEVRDVVARPPQGVDVKGFAPRETVSRADEGAEIYSPVHDYAFRGQGEVAGDVAGVIAMRRALCAIDFVRCDEVDLHAS